MATRTLESCFDRLSVNDENDPGESGRLYVKPKVCIELSYSLTPIQIANLSDHRLNHKHHPHQPQPDEPLQGRSAITKHKHRHSHRHAPLPSRSMEERQLATTKQSSLP